MGAPLASTVPVVVGWEVGWAKVALCADGEATREGGILDEEEESGEGPHGACSGEGGEEGQLGLGSEADFTNLG